MEASLQDHQSQQTYRPPAPSSTVGVSFDTAAYRRDSTGRRKRLPFTRQRTGNDDLDERAPRLSTQAEIDAIFDEDEGMPDTAEIPEQPGQDHGYRLRDRRSLVKPTNAVRTLFEMGHYTKPTKTYGSRGTRRAGRGGQARRGRGARTARRSWSMVRASNLYRPMQSPLREYC